MSIISDADRTPERIRFVHDSDDAEKADIWECDQKALAGYFLIAHEHRGALLALVEAADQRIAAAVAAAVAEEREAVYAFLISSGEEMSTASAILRGEHRGGDHVAKQARDGGEEGT